MVAIMRPRLCLCLAATLPGSTLFLFLCILSRPSAVLQPQPFFSDNQFSFSNSLQEHISVDMNVKPRTEFHVPQQKVSIDEYQSLSQDRFSNYCRDSLCSEYLSSDDAVKMAECLTKVKSYNVTRIDDGGCRFMDGRGRAPVALASFPGSGNTWVRGLLEKATGVCTGAFACDISLRARGFTGENLQGSSVIAVKTHRNVPYWKSAGKPAALRSLKDEAQYGAAIVIVRNLFHALVAEWHRVVSNQFRVHTITLESHSNRAGEEWFGNNTKWAEFIDKKAPQWQLLLRNWVVNSWRRYPVLVVRFEDLKQNAMAEVRRMLGFLEITYTEAELEARLNDSYHSFRREHVTTVNPFTPSQRVFINSVIQEAASLAELHGLGSVLRLTEYLDTSTDT